MQPIDRQENRQPVAVAKTARDDRQFIDIVTLSLAGLSLALLQIAQYGAHTNLLRAMFGQ